MKQRSTTPVSIKVVALRATIIAVVFLMVGVASVRFSQQASANNFDAQINAIQNEINQYQSQAQKLSKEADTLKNKLAILGSQKSVILSQIRSSEAKRKKLEDEITKTEKKIEDNRDALGETIASMYVDDSISPLEMLASSDNIGDYVDKQEYRSTVRDNLTGTIEQIKVLKKKLEEKKLGVERTLTDQKAQRKLLDEREAERQSLLRDTRGKESSYRKLASDGRKHKEDLQRQQQAAIEAAISAAGGGGSAVAGDPSKGGYPANLANSNYYSPVVDPWGMYSRQCVSYTAWKVYQKNGYMPYWGGVGNANQWPGNASAAGIPVSGTPKAGSVGVIMAGQYGHVVWVDSVNANGTVNVSQYNELNAGGSGWGHYSERKNVPAGAYDMYIHF